MPKLLLEFVIAEHSCLSSLPTVLLSSYCTTVVLLAFFFFSARSLPHPSSLQAIPSQYIFIHFCLFVIFPLHASMSFRLLSSPPLFFHSLFSIFSFLVLFPYSCALRNFRSSFLAYSLSSSYVLPFCPLLDTRPSFSCLIFPSNPLPSFQPFVPLVFSTYYPSTSVPITPCVISLFPPNPYVLRPHPFASRRGHVSSLV
jgi:hypothetical protein